MTGMAEGRFGQTAAMTTIQVRADQVYRLAATLEDLAVEAHQVGTDLAGTHQVAADLQATIEGFLANHRTAAQALAGELHWLGATIGAVASSWVRLDHFLLSVQGRASAE
jgi:phage tail sheath protein FI